MQRKKCQALYNAFCFLNKKPFTKLCIFALYNACDSAIICTEIEGGDKMQISEKKKITNNRYLAKCAQISLKPRQEDAAKIKAAAAAAGQSVQGYILQACTERMERDGFTPPTDESGQTEEH